MVKITSRESLEAHVAETVRLKLAHASLLARVEAEKVEVEKRYAGQLGDQAKQIAGREEVLAAYCVVNRKALFPEKQSMETRTAVFGFRMTPPRVDKPKKTTWEVVLEIARALPWANKYIRPGKESINKDALLEDRQVLTQEQLEQLHIRFEQDELFFITPKPEMAEGVVMSAE